jgi:hypothetical protein
MADFHVEQAGDRYHLINASSGLRRLLEVTGLKELLLD